MQRLRRAALPLALVAALAAVVVFSTHDSAAELDASVYTSREDRLRVIVPRGWRASDQPTYPGLRLWMSPAPPKNQKVVAGQIQLTTEAFTRALYCSWPVPCRTSREGLASRYACALRTQLEAQKFRVGPVQAGPRENETAGLSSVWFEFDDGKHFLRQAVAFSADRAITLVLSAPTGDGRSFHTRAFEQALRTMRLLSFEEAEPATGIDAAVAVVPGDAGPIDAQAPADAAALDAGVTFQSSPPPKIEPIGPCP